MTTDTQPVSDKAKLADLLAAAMQLDQSFMDRCIDREKLDAVFWQHYQELRRAIARVTETEKEGSHA